MDFSPKRVGETEVFTVDYANLLAPGETIISASWSVTVKSGTDSNPSAMISGGASIIGTKVSQLLTGGVAGVVYLPVCTVTTIPTGQVLKLPESGTGALQVVAN